MTDTVRVSFFFDLFVKFLVKFILLFAFIIGSYFPHKAMAAGGIVISPQLVELDNKNRNTVLTLANRGQETETYRISVINYRMDAQGNLFEIDKPIGEDAFANGLFRFAPRQVTLKPGSPQTVRVLYRRPSGLKDGEYRSHLLFQQVPETTAANSNTANRAGISVEIKTIFGISIPIIVRHGSLSGNGEITELKPAKKENGSDAISLRINRTGNQSLRGDVILSSDGKEVGRLNNVAVYLSTPYREVVVPLVEEKLQTLSGKTISVDYRPRKGETGPVIASNNITIR
ncbi:molecular chaperone [Kiloniella majae]|uniref:fimbrial biogenesis chaperone n=1 Tax=Kiloniella majae TaxID=1938558 RepID=UPI000F7AEB9E|nr:fimbria/pilus periplasmic chaperone [Kiloniella majae]